MPDLNIGALRAVGERLDGLGLNYAFVGGSIRLREQSPIRLPQ